jgi:hypothetical protein
LKPILPPAAAGNTWRSTRASQRMDPRSFFMGVVPRIGVSGARTVGGVSPVAEFNARVQGIARCEPSERGHERGVEVPKRDAPTLRTPRTRARRPLEPPNPDANGLFRGPMRTRVQAPRPSYAIGTLAYSGSGWLCGPRSSAPNAEFWPENDPETAPFDSNRHSVVIRWKDAGVACLVTARASTP